MSNKPYGERGWFTKVISDEQIIARCEEVHAQGRYPSRVLCALPIAGGRFYSVRNPWLERNGIQLSTRHGHGRNGIDRQSKHVDLTKPAMIAAGLGPELPMPSDPLPVLNPRTIEQVRALERQRRAADIAASIRAYKAARWRRPLKGQEVIV